MFCYRRANNKAVIDSLRSIDWRFLDSDEDLAVIVEALNSEIRRVIETLVSFQRPPF